MRVLLINPNRMKPAVAPIGLDYLADSIIAAGHEPLLLDLCFEEALEQAVEAGVKRASPDIIAVSIRNTDDCYFGSQAFFLPEVRSLVSLLRKLSTVPVALGGVGYSTAPAGILDFCMADFGIAGDGETAFVDLLSALEHRDELRFVPGLCYREGNDIRANPVRLVGLEQLPPRRRALVDNRRYFREGGQGGFETKRGCSMQCCYCADPIAKGRNVRVMAPARVVDELRAMLEQGVDHLHTCDSEFNLPPDHALGVCDEIVKAGISDRVRWYAYCAPVPFTDELASACKRAGCAGINFGVDSGSDVMLARLGRSFRAPDLERTATICHRHKIPFMFDLLIGGPGETPATLSETIELMKRIEPDCVGLSLGVRLYPGTQLAEQVWSDRNTIHNHRLRGATDNNPNLLAPVFYVSPELGPDIVATAHKLVAGDKRFFLPAPSDENRGYNYNDNTTLVEAIRKGARGAYWDILRCLR